MAEEMFEQLLMFYKVMANENRLRIIGLLADRERSVGELAEALDLREPTVSEHLSMMRHIGLVTVRPEGTRRVYAFDWKALSTKNKEMLSKDKLAEVVRPKPAGDEPERILANYLKDGRLVTIPASRKKLLVVLAFLVEQFEFGRRYTEKEVNKALKQFNEDSATLRRELVDFHFMERAKGEYWRVARSGQDQPS